MVVFFDIECYRNYFLALFKAEDGRKAEFVLHNDKRYADMKLLRAIFRENTLVSFNGNNYDIPIISAFVKGASNRRLKDISDAIIVDNVPNWKLHEQFSEIVIPRCDHIDLIGVTPLQASLKTYGCRIHSPKLQDLPIHPDATISEQDADLLRRYCENDVDVTRQVYEELLPQIELRADIGRNYATDMRSKSDVQIAETILRDKLTEQGVEVNKRTSKVKPFKYNTPSFIEFDDPTLREVLKKVQAARFTVSEKGAVVLPESIDIEIPFSGATYKLGVGGLHSQEKQQVVTSDKATHFGELDVASFYPSIILGQKLYPKHLGEAFVDIYRDIFDTRIAAKHSGDKVTADTLKIVLNGSYGKFGSPYSFLYSPELLVQTTMTGQLALLMLIEWLSYSKAKVTSANTDGVNVLFNKAVAKMIKYVVDLWQERTGYELEWTPYQATYSESVNSYVAIKPDGSTKTKGLYESGSIRKGYSAQVCNEAVINYLVKDIPIEQTVNDCTDIRQFLVMRGVRGGGVWRGAELGKVVRWYYSTEGEPITYRANGNKVATSDGAVPMMNLIEELPDDLNFAWYIDNAHKKLKRLGL